MRFGTNLVIDKHIDEKYNDFRLPPLAIQTLLENAIKHNEVSKRYPLTITIETNNDQTLRFSNLIRERNTPEYSSGVGLVEPFKTIFVPVRKRYCHLTEKQ